MNPVRERVRGAGRAQTPRRETSDSSFLLSIFVVVLFLLPARFVVVGAGAAGRPAVAIGLSALVLWALAFLRPRKVRRRPQVMKWLLAVHFLIIGTAYVLGLDRGLQAVELRAADREMIVLFSLLGIALAAMDGLPTRLALDHVLLRVSYAAGAMGIIGAIQFLTNFDPTRLISIPGLALNRGLISVGHRGPDGIPRVAGTAGHYIEFGVVLALVLPVALHYARYALTPSQLRARWACVVLIGISIPFSVSRAGIVAVAVALVIASGGWHWRTRLNIAVGTLIGAALLRFIKPGLMETITGLFASVGTDPSIAGRTNDYEIVATYIRDRPWFGRGPGTFIPEKYVLLDNHWIAQVVSAGYIGAATLAILFLAGAVMALTIGRQTEDERTRDLAQALLAALATAAVTSFFFDSMHFAIFAGMVFLLLGVVGALWQLSSPARRADASQRNAEPSS